MTDTANLVKRLRACTVTKLRDEPYGLETIPVPVCEEAAIALEAQAARIADLEANIVHWPVLRDRFAAEHIAGLQEAADMTWNRYWGGKDAARWSLLERCAIQMFVEDIVDAIRARIAELKARFPS